MNALLWLNQNPKTMEKTYLFTIEKYWSKFFKRVNYQATCIHNGKIIRDSVFSTNAKALEMIEEWKVQLMEEVHEGIIHQEVFTVKA